MRIAVDQARGIERPPDGEDHQPRHAEALLGAGVRFDHLEQGAAVEPFEAEHPLPAALADHLRDHQLWIPRRRLAIGVGLRRFLAVVELAQERCAKLVVVRPLVERRAAGQGEAAHQHRRVGEVALQRLVHAGILHLHHHLAAVVQARGVHLPQRRGREGLLGKAGEELGGRLPSSARTTSAPGRSPSAAAPARATSPPRCAPLRAAHPGPWRAPGRA